MALNVSSIDTVLATTDTTVATSLALTQVTVLKCSVLNTDSSPHSISLYRVPLAGSASASNQIIKDYVLGANATVVLPIAGQVLYNGQSFVATASANSSVTFSISLATTP